MICMKVSLGDVVSGTRYRALGELTSPGRAGYRHNGLDRELGYKADFIFNALTGTMKSSDDSDDKLWVLATTRHGRYLES
jgi:hypothetical protein